MTTQFYKITDEAAWLEKRKGYVTSTEVAGLFGVAAPYNRTAYELWHTKRGLIDDAVEENSHMRFGKLLEEPICHMILMEHPDWRIDQFPFFAYDDEDKIGASFDRVVTIGEKSFLMEIKSISYAQYKKDFIEHDDGSIEASPHYEIQAQVELEVAGQFDGILIPVFILDTRQLKYIFRNRDIEMGAAMREAVREFWAMEAPPLPEYARDKALIAKLCPAVDVNNTLDATENTRLTELAGIYKTEKELEKQSKANADAAYAEILHLLGSARYAWTKHHKISRSDVKASGKEVTQEMVGTRINERAAHTRLTITEI